jgi:hypothetical protein
VPIIKKPAKRAGPPLESNIQREIMRAVCALPDARVERNNKWSGFVVRDDGSRAFVEAGLPDGSADLIGTVKVLVTLCGREVHIARAFYLEIKRPGEKQLPSQLEWMGKAHYMTAFYAVVHSVDEALAAVERCRRGEIR